MLSTAFVGGQQSLSEGALGTLGNACAPVSADTDESRWPVKSVLKPGSLCALLLVPAAPLGSRGEAPCVAKVARVLVSWLTDLMLSYQEEEEQEEEDDDEDDDDTDDLDELDTDQLLEAELEEDDTNENAGEDGDNDFSPSDEELANLLEEGEDAEDEDSDADEEVELILGDSKSAAHCEPGHLPCAHPAPRAAALGFCARNKSPPRPLRKSPSMSLFCRVPGVASCHQRSLTSLKQGLLALSVKSGQ